MAKVITSADYDKDIIAQGLEHQIKTYYMPAGGPEKLRIDIVLKFLDPKKGEKILDAGCGVGTFAFHCAKNGAAASGLDYSKESINAAKTLSAQFGAADKTSFFCGNALKMPFSDKSFNKVVSADFIEHITDKEKEQFLSEIMRVLKPGGIAVIFTPNAVREKIGDVYWGIRHKMFGNKIPVNELHYGLISKKAFEKLMIDKNIRFRHFYADITRPWLAKIPVLNRWLSLNLLWTIQK